LTADLCPSKHSLDRVFFTEVIKRLGKEESPVPLAIAITGIWMEEHPDDFSWLLDLVKSGSISVTWINHSYHHRTGRDTDLSRDFLLSEGTDIDHEILMTEKKLIENGALPSVFFRFPGLVSNDSLVKKVVSFGLIPIGSDAWLAKNQWPTDGSIVLVHANGNEPVGIQRFFKLLDEERPNIDNRQWSLFDLRESLIETEKEPYHESRAEPQRTTPRIAPRLKSEDLELCE
jgi:peptidoglycan/xylan/chitin deacetylase (PgdA/CDA1 family)